MPVSERWLAAGSCLRKGASLVAQLCHLSEGHVEDARQELSAASATALRQARVIGVTVVGAARRLEALRAAEPFAMVRGLAGLDDAAPRNRGRKKRVLPPVCCCPARLSESLFSRCRWLRRPAKSWSPRSWQWSQWVL